MKGKNHVEVEAVAKSIANHMNGNFSRVSHPWKAKITEDKTTIILTYLPSGEKFFVKVHEDIKFDVAGETNLPSLNEFFEMTKKAGHDSLDISKDIVALKALKILAKQDGNLEDVKSIEEQIQELERKDVTED